MEYSDTEDVGHGRRKRRKSERGQDESLTREQEQGQGLDDRIKRERALEDTICGAKGRLDVARMELDRGREREEMEARREVDERRRRGHECPVPKPGGWVGALLGFREERDVESEHGGKGDDGVGR